MKICDLVPMLPAADLNRTIEFYRALGFVCENKIEQEGRIIRCALRSDTAHIMFFCTDAHHPTVNAPQSDGVVLYFHPDDVVGLHRSLKSRGYAVTNLVVTFSGMKEFHLTDPDGYQLIFGQEAKESETKCG
jgi:catechol 2,3-dioxygenase-like lactoylglutathione lyase family enzyme